MKSSDLEAAKPGDTLKDDQVRGLHLRCFAGGKGWYLYYRNQQGKQRKPKIGNYPAIKLEQARTIARRQLAEVAMGGDPSRRRALTKAAETVSDLCDRYLSEHALTNKKERSIAEDRRYIEKIIKPSWGKLQPTEVTEDDIGKLRRDNVKTPIRFNRCLALISKMWSFARLPSITKDITKFPEKPRQRFLSANEIAVVAKVLAKNEVQYPRAVAAIRLLLITGARMGEIIRCRREWYHGDHLLLEDHKTSGHIGHKFIPLPKEAQEIINRLPPEGDYLCGISWRPTRVWNKIVEETGLPHFTIHDLRRTFVSRGLSGGFSLDVLGKLIGHKNTSTTNRYAFLAQNHQQSAAIEIGASMSVLMRQTPDDNTTPATQD
jgi:integrase